MAPWTTQNLSDLDFTGILTAVNTVQPAYTKIASSQKVCPTPRGVRVEDRVLTGLHNHTAQPRTRAAKRR